MREPPKLPIGPIRFTRVRLTPSTALQFEARVVDNKGAAQALRRIADQVERGQGLPPRVFVNITVDPPENDG